MNSSDLKVNTGQSISQLLEQMDPAKRASLTQIFPGIYEDLRMIAGRYMANQPHNHTLQPTALVNEAFLNWTFAAQESSNSVSLAA